jgi:hypothetical protein
MWEYRIIKEGGQYTVREFIQTEEIGDGWTEDEVSPYGESRDEMRQMFTYYLEAVTKPILVVEGDKIIGEEKPLTVLEPHERTRKNKKTTTTGKRKAR